MGTETSIDEATLTVVWHGLQRICREMRYLIDRTAQNFLIAQMHDVSVGIWDNQARTVAIPTGLPAQYIGGKLSVRHILEEYRDRIYPGDVFLVNDPYHGHCCHTPDWGFFKPVFFRDELLFFALARAHQEDTGAAYPGAYFHNPYDIHSEGILIPPIKVFEKGVECKEIYKLILNNVRFPEGVRVDNNAQLGALNLCENRLQELLEKYGRDAVVDCTEEMIDRTEAVIRQSILKIPDGTYYGESATDDDGVNLEVPVWVRCEITIRGDEMVIDFSKSDPQQKGFINATYFTTYSCAMAAAILFFDSSLAPYHNEGTMKPIEVIAPEGRVVNSRYPAPTGGAPVNVGGNILEAVVMALSAALPERAAACWGRRYGHYVYGENPRTGNLYVMPGYEAEGGAGAVTGYDGYHGTGTLGTLGELNRGNIEDIEIRYPWRILCQEMRVDSCGVGKWRGGAGLRWGGLNEGGPAGFHTGAGQGEITSAPGVQGGWSTFPNRGWLVRDGEKSPIRCHRLYQLQPGDAVWKETGGGAGVGNPHERDPRKVWEDVVTNQLVTIEAARNMYKVVIDPDTLKVDEEKTRLLRQAVHHSESPSPAER